MDSVKGDSRRRSRGVGEDLSVAVIGVAAEFAPVEHGEDELSRSAEDHASRLRVIHSNTGFNPHSGCPSGSHFGKSMISA
jgi:hypothetical protein